MTTIDDYELEVLKAFEKGTLESVATKRLREASPKLRQTSGKSVTRSTRKA